MANRERVGVVTVTYNSGSVLPDFLRCLAAQTHRDFILFAVDNASKDNSMETLRAWTDDRLKIIANLDNKGVAEGNNQGIRAAIEAGCDSVLLLNNDTEFGPTLIAQLVEGLDMHQADMICPKMMYFDEPERIWSAGGRFVPWLGYMNSTYGADEIDRGQHDRVKTVTDVQTCCVLIRKKVFDRVGLMDERYFVYVDDSDFMFRAMKVGLKLIYLPSAKLLHKVSTLTGGSESTFAIHYGTRNRVFFQLKHFGILRTLPWIAVRQIAWLSTLFLGKKKLAWYRLKNAAVRSALEMHKRYSEDKNTHVRSGAI